MSCEMTFETYLRQQAEGDHYGVALIKSEIALRIADWIELHRDAVKVVRCKDCRYFKKGENERESWSICARGIVYPYVDVEPSDFCSYGERRNDA